MHHPPHDNDLTRSFSLDRRVSQPTLQSATAHPTMIAWLRIFLKIAPVFAWYFLMAGLKWLGAFNWLDDVITPLLIIGLGILCAYGIGYCDAFLCDNVPKKNGTPEIKAALSHAIFFTILQIVIAPLTLVAVGFFLYIAFALLTT